jgi:hypothetical protein
MIMQQPLSERQKRQAVMRQFELQLARFPVLELLERLTNYRYRFKLHDHARSLDVLATVLATSFDFYQYRLNLHQQGVELVICQRHDAVLPVYVLELETATMYQPGTSPDIERPREQRKKRNQEEVRVFISQLLVGVESAYAELWKMPPRTRQHYLALRAAYLRPRVGRPWAS